MFESRESDLLREVARALSDKTRLHVFMTIASAGEISCGEIAKRFPVGQPTVSHHLRVLASAGLVDVRREGQYAFFSMKRDTLKQFLSLVEALLEQGD